jgi:hypothetical protein
MWRHSRVNCLQVRGRLSPQSHHAGALISEFQPPELWETCFCSLQATCLWYFVVADWTKTYYWCESVLYCYNNIPEIEYFLICFSETESHCKNRLALNFWPTYLSLPSAGITGMCHHAWLKDDYFIKHIRLFSSQFWRFKSMVLVCWLGFPGCITTWVEKWKENQTHEELANSVN